MFMVLITIVTGAYKPTYNWGASHCNYQHDLWNIDFPIRPQPPAVNKTHLAAVGRARQRDAAPQGIAAMLQVCQGDIMGLPSGKLAT